MNVLATEELLRRLDQVESREAIRQLAADYARLVDAKDLQAVANLFVPDVIVGDDVGREARHRALLATQGRAGNFRRSVHFIGGHSIEMDADNPDRATGVLYCRAEHEMEDLWVIAMLQYWDTYSRIDGRWMFQRRQLQAYYVADVLERPNGEPIKHQVTNTGVVSVATLPEAWPTWEPFCRAQGIDPDIRNRHVRQQDQV